MGGEPTPLPPPPDPGPFPGATPASLLLTRTPQRQPRRLTANSAHLPRGCPGRHGHRGACHPAACWGVEFSPFRPCCRERQGGRQALSGPPPRPPFLASPNPHPPSLGSSPGRLLPSPTGSGTGCSTGLGDAPQSPIALCFSSLVAPTLEAAGEAYKVWTPRSHPQRL